MAMMLHLFLLTGNFYKLPCRNSTRCHLITNFQWLINWGLWPSKRMDYQWQQIVDQLCRHATAPQWRSSWLTTEASPMTRETLYSNGLAIIKVVLRRPWSDAREKFSLHFSIIKQEAPEVGGCMGRLTSGPSFWCRNYAVFVNIFDFMFLLFLNLLITSLPEQFWSILYIFNYTFYKKKFYNKSFLTFLLGFVY